MSKVRVALSLIPPWNAWLGVGLYVMTFWILWMLAPAQGQEPSELFKLLAQAIVLTAFVNGVVGAVYTASQKKTEKIVDPGGPKDVG